jgi:hypothetical protein
MHTHTMHRPPQYTDKRLPVDVTQREQPKQPSNMRMLRQSTQRTRQNVLKRNATALNNKMLQWTHLLKPMTQLADEAPVANNAADPDVVETADHDADNMAVDEEIGVVAPESAAPVVSTPPNSSPARRKSSRPNRGSWKDHS